MPRFVVLVHDWPEPHLDLLIENDGVLKAWRLPTNFVPTADTPAEANTDHRLHYLDYEGPVSDDRGTVTRWDAGAATWESFAGERVVIQLSGHRIRGRFELVHRDGSTWELRPLAESSLRGG